MTTTTQTVRDQAFRALECDVPEELTLAQYRAARARPARRRRRPRLRRR
jgi:hypothetical protein